MKNRISQFFALFLTLSGCLIIALFLAVASISPAWATNGESFASSPDETAIASEEKQKSEVSEAIEGRKMENTGPLESFSTKMFEDTPDSIEQPSYPGVINKLLEKEAAGEPAIKLYYPAFGNEEVDNAIKTWLEARLAYYNGLVKDSIDGVEELEQRENWEMTGFYTLERPKPDIASILFNIYAYTGGAHGNLWLYSLNYNLKNGQQILFENMFGNPQKALELLSSISIEKLRLAIGEDTDEDWLERGAGPEADNFAVLTLMPDGLFVEFQPYQVGPWAIGPQRVFISIKELREALPSETIWNLPPQAPEANEPEKTNADETSADETNE